MKSCASGFTYYSDITTDFVIQRAKLRLLDGLECAIAGQKVFLVIGDQKNSLN